MFFILIFLLSVNHAYSQFCGASAQGNPNIYPEPNEMNRAYNYETNICLDIQFHVVRESNGSLAFSPRNPDDIINELNLYFNEHQIFFNSVGVNFINNSNYVNLEENEYDSLISIDNNPNALNLYLVDDMWGNTAGAAYLPSRNLVVRNFWSIYWVTAHEIGHCLDLHHTFKGSSAEPAGCPEAIDGSNCSDCGDFICDTPADSNQGATGGFSPDLDNLMSYYNSPNHFSDGQGYRMRQAVLNNPVLQSLTNGSCSISSIKWVYDNRAATCLNEDKTFELSNIPANNGITWTVTNNLTIVNSTSDTITIRLNSFGGDAVITGTIVIDSQTYIFTLELEQLDIPSANNIILSSFRSEPIFTDRWTNITASYNNLIDVGQLGYTWQWVVPSHQVRHNHSSYSYIHVRPMVNMSSVYIKTRAMNECGYSNWKGKWFDIEEPDSGCTSCPTTGGEVHS